MKVLIACEESQTVCKAFRAKGHEAFSNDLLPCSGGHPEWHMQMDVFEALAYHTNPRLRGVASYWNLVIAFPPCTHLSVSGARWFKDKAKEQQEAITFFRKLTAYSGKWAIENPIGIMSTHYRKPDQIIQPWQFGHGETKATCLWLNGLPTLYPTDIVSGREQRIWKMAPGPERAKERSKTFPGIAQAMADQWG